MSRKNIKNMAHSVNMRLKELSKMQKNNFSYILLRYAIERFLYRLGISSYAENFILKGASAFTV